MGEEKIWIDNVREYLDTIQSLSNIIALLFLLRLRHQALVLEKI